MCQMRFPRQIDRAEPHGFIYLIHEIARLSGSRTECLRKADLVVALLLETMQGVDDALDSPSDNNRRRLPRLVSLTSGALARVESLFGKGSFLQTYQTIHIYMEQFAEMFDMESEVLSRLKGAQRLGCDTLLAMQETRNIDLRFYFEVYGQLVGLSKELRESIGKRLLWFGSVDVTIDDYLDLRHDLSHFSYNLFLLYLSLKLGLQSYPRGKSLQTIFELLHTERVLEDVLELINPSSRRWFERPPLIGVNEYLRAITYERYQLLQRTFSRITLRPKP